MVVIDFQVLGIFYFFEINRQPVFFVHVAAVNHYIAGISTVVRKPAVFSVVGIARCGTVVTSASAFPVI